MSVSNGYVVKEGARENYDSERFRSRTRRRQSTLAS